jgi:hypothetical protein
MQEGARKLFRAEMIRRLAKRPWITDHSKQNKSVLSLEVEAETTDWQYYLTLPLLVEDLHLDLVTWKLCARITYVLLLVIYKNPMKSIRLSGRICSRFYQASNSYWHRNS